jgi:hypothetical protein
VTRDAQRKFLSGFLRIMLAFAKRRKEHRIARGCLTLASAEVKFEFDSETHDNITDVHEYVSRNVEALIFFEKIGRFGAHLRVSGPQRAACTQTRAKPPILHPLTPAPQVPPV